MKMLIRRAALPLVLLLVLSALPAAAQQPQGMTPANAEQTEAARSAAEDWLAHVDAGDHAQSWEEAAAMLQDEVAEEEWATTLASVQQQTGALQERSFAEAQYATQLPNVPEGQYMIVRYDSAYDNISGRETVILVSEEEAWRVAGYAVRPAAPAENQ